MTSSILQDTSSSNSPTGQIARFVHQSRWRDFPAAVRHEALRAFVNWVGCAVGGASHPAVQRALPALSALSGAQACTVLGASRQLDPLNAALLNGLSASAYAFDDTHLATIAHPTAPTVAALLAYAEMHPVSGEDFLHALMLSNEVQCRLSLALAVPPAQCHLGLYMTGITGPAGVAAGVGKLMGLSAQQLVWAIGIGATQGSGLRATHGTLCGGFPPANAGRNGLLAAHLAQAGLTCHDDALGSKHGLLPVFGQPPNVAALTQGLGESYACMDVVAKPYPAGVLVHPIIDACLQIADAHAIPSEEIECIALQVHELGLGLTGNKAPKHAQDAQVSIYHWAAAVLHHRRAGLHEASEACVHDPAVVALRQRIEVTVADDLRADEARVIVTLRDGTRHEAAALPCLGSAQRPMSDAQLDAKLISQATDLFGPDGARQLATHCWNLPQAGDVRQAAPGFWGHDPRPLQRD